MIQSEADLRKQLEERLEFERLLADVATSFVGLPADQVDGAIETAQRRIGETLGVDRSSLFQFSADGEMILTHSWIASGFQPFPSQIRAREHFPWALQKTLQGEIVRFSSVAELPPEAVRDLETIRQHVPKSTVVVPLMSDGQVFGGLAFGTLREERQWTDDLVARLRLVASLFESALTRKRCEESF
ncbi:MAG TPA: GAF domain-containing protein, partial [Candidatus Methylomirabilis sp.]|nr:GAF domain-containing protein [Candidatus Methylomirabilis sp.]